MEHYELYHGTKRENVLKIIDSQKFIVNEDEENKLFLGKGAYFYLDKMNAVDWNCRDVANKNKIIFPNILLRFGKLKKCWIVYDLVFW